MRVKTRWFKEKKERTIEDIASVLSFNCFQIAKERIRYMEGEGYYINLPKRTLDVIAEYLAFLAHTLDRMTYERFGPENRATFLGEVAHRLGDIMQENRNDTKDNSQTKSQFVDFLNQRFSEYAELPYQGDEPSYGVFRYLAQNIATVMGEGHNQWVIERVIDIDGPECIDVLKRVTKRILVDDSKQESLSP